MKKIFMPVIALSVSAIAISGCASGGWFGKSKADPLPGERVSVLELQTQLEPDDPALSAQGFVAPDPWVNEFWPQAGGYPNHVMQHLALNAGPLQQVWRASIGDGATKGTPLTAAPIVVDGQVFTIDRRQNLTAFAAADGKKLWSVDLRKDKSGDLVIGGGVAYSAGRLYVTNGYNQLLCLDPRDGALIWEKGLPAPSRAAPTIADGRVFVVTMDSKIVAFNADSGQYLWDYAGIGTIAGLVGQASPAASGNLVISAFSSGELYALQAENGALSWSENLSGQRVMSGLQSITDISGLPVVDKGMVFAISFGGRLAAIDERTGARVWQRDIGSPHTPWVAGNHMFIITNENELVAIGRDNGIIRWVTRLPRFENPDKRKHPIQWTAPVLAGGRLILAASNGEVAEIDTQGALIRTWNAGMGISLPLIVAGETLYMLADNGTLLAYR